MCQAADDMRELQKCLQEIEFQKTSISSLQSEIASKTEEHAAALDLIRQHQDMAAKQEKIIEKHASDLQTNQLIRMEQQESILDLNIQIAEILNCNQSKLIHMRSEMEQQKLIIEQLTAEEKLLQSNCTSLREEVSTSTQQSLQLMDVINSLKLNMSQLDLNNATLQASNSDLDQQLTSDIGTHQIGSGSQGPS